MFFMTGRMEREQGTPTTTNDHPPPKRNMQINTPMLRVKIPLAVSSFSFVLDIHPPLLCFLFLRLFLLPPD